MLDKTTGIGIGLATGALAFVVVVTAVAKDTKEPTQDQLAPLKPELPVAASVVREVPEREAPKPVRASADQSSTDASEQKAAEAVQELVAALDGTEPQPIADSYMKVVLSTGTLSDAEVRALAARLTKSLREQGYPIYKAKQQKWVFINMLKDSVLAGHDPRFSFALLASIRPLHRKPYQGGDGLNHDVEGAERTIDSPTLLADSVRFRAKCETAAAPDCDEIQSARILSKRLPAAIADGVPEVPLASISAEKMVARLIHALEVYLPDDPKAIAAKEALRKLPS